MPRNVGLRATRRRLGRLNDAPKAAVPAVDPTPQIFFASTSIVCPVGARKVRLMALGAGGGPYTAAGLGYNGGSSGGSNASGVYDVDPAWWGTTITITVGAAAAANTAGGSSIISWPAAGLTLTGTGGNCAAGTAGAVGTAATGGQVNNTGRSGASSNSGIFADGAGGGAAGGLDFPAGGDGAAVLQNSTGPGGGGVGAYGGWRKNSGNYAVGFSPASLSGVVGPGQMGSCFDGYSAAYGVGASGKGGGGAGGGGSYSGTKSDVGMAYVQFT